MQHASPPVLIAFRRAEWGFSVAGGNQARVTVERNLIVSRGSKFITEAQRNGSQLFRVLDGRLTRAAIYHTGFHGTASGMLHSNNLSGHITLPRGPYANGSDLEVEHPSSYEVAGYLSRRDDGRWCAIAGPEGTDLEYIGHFDGIGAAVHAVTGH